MQLNETIIKTILKNINIEVANPEINPSLLVGSPGQALFNVLYSKHFNENDLNDELLDIIQQIVDVTADFSSYSLCDGQAGVCWFFSYLYKCGYIDYEDWRVICSENLKLTDCALYYLEAGNYDFLHGALGIAYYILDVESSNEVFFQKFFEGLYLIMEKNNGLFPFFSFHTHKLDETRINLGLAHGLPSVLKFCLECISQDVCKESATMIAKNITEYLLNHSNVNHVRCFYPSMIDLNEESSTFSRLAWCYGDLCVAFVLYQSGAKFNDKKTIDFAMSIFRHSLSRTEEKDTAVKDAGVCHGSAGIAHIYNKMWHITNDQAFKIACDHWITVTVKYSHYEDTVSGYKKFDQISSQYMPKFGLLNGSAGIGLVLMSYLTSDFSWDYCLMLN